MVNSRCGTDELWKNQGLVKMRCAGVEEAPVPDHPLCRAVKSLCFLVCVGELMSA